MKIRTLLAGAVLMLAPIAPVSATTLIYHQTGIGEGGGVGFAVTGELDFTGPDLPTISFSGSNLGGENPIPRQFPTIASLAADGLTGLHIAYAPPPPKEEAREFNLIDLTFTTDSVSWYIAPGPSIRLQVDESPASGRGAETLDIRGGRIAITDDFQCGSDCSAIGEWVLLATVPEPGSLGLLMAALLGLGLCRGWCQHNTHTHSLFSRFSRRSSWTEISANLAKTRKNPTTTTPKMAPQVPTRMAIS